MSELILGSAEPRNAPAQKCGGIAEAEQYGTVEVGYTAVNRLREVRIDMGKWGNARCQVWGRGNTIEIACGKAIVKARMVAHLFPHPDEC